MEEKTRYSLNFDLDTKKLEELYPEKNWRKAYEDLRISLEEAKFIHVQGSGYHSEDEMEIYDVIQLKTELEEKFPWLKESIKNIYATEIGKQYDLQNILHETEQEQLPKTYSEKVMERMSRYYADHQMEEEMDLEF